MTDKIITWYLVTHHAMSPVEILKPNKNKRLYQLKTKERL